MLAYHDDSVIVPWVANRLGYAPHDFEQARSIGIVRQGNLIAGVIYTEYREDSISMTIASTSPMWASKDNLYYLFDYPFNQLGCRRVTAFTAKKNKKSRKFLERLGFKLEGLIREGFQGKDACVYGMLKRECKWLEY